MSTNDGALYEAVVLHNLRTNQTAGEATRPRPWHDNKTRRSTSSRICWTTAPIPPARDAHDSLRWDGARRAGVPTPINEAPFARALRAQDVAAIKLMLDKGANPSAPVAGSLPLALAMGAGGGRGFAGGFGAAPAASASGDRTPATAVASLLDAGADLNAVNDAGETALHTAAQTGNVAMIRLFAQRGAKLDAQNKAGFTPLDLAMGKGAPPAAAALEAAEALRPDAAADRRTTAQAIAALRELMGLPPLAPNEMPGAPGNPQRGGGN